MFGIGQLLGAAAGVGTSIWGASKAAKAQRKAIDDATRLQEKGFKEQEAALEPWQTAGEEALKSWSEKVMAGPGEFEESEAYKWTLGEGEKAIKRAAATGPGFGTGAMGKSLIRYGQGLASTEYDKFQDRYLKSLVPYQQLAGVGQWATGTEVGLRERYTDAVTGLRLDRGDVSANKYATIANALRSGISEYTTLSKLGRSSSPIPSAPTYGRVPIGGSIDFDPGRISLNAPYAYRK